MLQTTIGCNREKLGRNRISWGKNRGSTETGSWCTQCSRLQILRALQSSIFVHSNCLKKLVSEFFDLCYVLWYGKKIRHVSQFQVFVEIAQLRSFMWRLCFQPFFYRILWTIRMNLSMGFMWRLVYDPETHTFGVVGLKIHLKKWISLSLMGLIFFWRNGNLDYGLFLVLFAYQLSGFYIYHFDPCYVLCCGENFSTLCSPHVWRNAQLKLLCKVGEDTCLSSCFVVF